MLIKELHDKKIASEGGHYYYPDGRTAYEVENKSKPGELRPTTIRDARKLGLYPSVTEILKLTPKPQLIAWIKKQVLMSALTLTRQSDEADEAYITRILIDADEQARKAREKGIWIHGQLERYLLKQSVDIEAGDYIEGVIFAMTSIDPNWRAKCETEKSFSCTVTVDGKVLGFGGKTDLHSREINFVADFKTKEFDETADKLAWDEQIIQLEAYRRGLGMPTARMINVFISTSKPGLVRVVEHEDVDGWYWDVFRDALKFWYTWKKY